jgi:eukaryotic-like serine/threonine-protein kinase
LTFARDLAKSRPSDLQNPSHSIDLIYTLVYSSRSSNQTKGSYLSITIGTQLGSVEILALLGRGGMGEVYRARDIKLKREVAIKILPDEFSRDADRVSRFQREAEVVASLSHPNIAGIHSLEEANGARFLVLELVEGETLAERIKRGPTPVDESLNIVRSICEALEAAHEKGIIHRDLKPANVKITPEGKVKVLDFGLAKALESTPANTAVSNSPTLSFAATNAGLILGTAAYMSPEQAKGRAVDRRTDVFALGAVLYEMLTGQAAFEGEDVPDILGAVLKSEPDWTRLPSDVPLRIRELLRLCLQKDAKKRRQTATDVRIDIEQALVQPPVLVTTVTPARKSRERIAWAIAVVALITVGALLAEPYFVPAPAPPVASRFLIELPPEATLLSGTSASPFPTVSPDGRYIVFAALSGGVPRLWLRPIGLLAAQPIAGTDGIAPTNSNPFWSADSRFIGFFAGGKLKKVAVGGGPPQILCDAVGDSIAGTWNQDDVILFENSGSVHRVAAAGGVSTPVRMPDKSKDAGTYKFPYFLPDGQHFVYVAGGSKPEVRLGALESTDDKSLFATNSRVLYAPPNHLLFVRDGTLMAQPFDARNLSLTGDVFPIAEQIAFNPGTGAAALSVSTNGTLVYRANAAAATTELTWFDRSGKNLGIVRAKGNFQQPRLSPDQSRVAVRRLDGGNGDIWLIDLLRGTSSRFTFDPGDDQWPIFSSDGKQIAFASNRDFAWGLYIKSATGGGAEELIHKVEGSPAWVDNWSSDGKVLLYETVLPATGRDSWALSMTGERRSYPVVNDKFTQQGSRLSPDGRWILYLSNESGRFEVYVQAFPPSGGKWQVSVDGASASGGNWRDDGKEIVFQASDGKMMAVDVKLGATFEAGIPRPLFQVPGPIIADRYAMSPNAQRFLFPLAPQSGDRPTLTTVLNWASDIEK